jgi:Zn-dependent protease with chaperone function
MRVRMSPRVRASGRSAAPRRGLIHGRSGIIPRVGTHEARAFHPSLPGGQQGGTLSLSHHVASWVGESGSVEMPISGIGIEVGGASDRIVFLTHPGLPDWAITVAGLEVLRDPALTTHPALATLAARGRRKHVLGWVLGLTPLVLLALGVIALVAFRPVLVRSIAEQVPVGVEVALGTAAAESLVSSPQTILIEDSDADTMLAALTAPLLAAMKDKRFEYEFRIVNDASINAFALPGGKVFVHTGLLLAADRPEEVAGVLAHEMAHVQERHSLRSLIEQLGLLVLVQLFLGDATGIQGVLVAAGPQLLSLKFSRDFELEADASGFGYLVDAGLDPSGMASMFRKLDAQHGTGVAGLDDTLALLQTHPPARERFEALDAMAAERGAGAATATFDVDFEAFQARLRDLGASGRAPGTD